MRQLERCKLFKRKWWENQVMRAKRFKDEKINCLWGSDQLEGIFVTRVKSCFTFMKSSKAVRLRRQKANRDMGH